MDDRVAIASIHRSTGNALAIDQDLVAVEAPLQLTLHDRSSGLARPLGLLMRTPGDDRDLVIGWLYTEGLVQTLAAVESVTFSGNADDGELAEVTVAGPIDRDAMREAERGMAGTSACGLCGRLAIRRVDTLALRDSSPDESWPASLISALPGRLRAGQRVFAETGGLHAAGLFDAGGSLRMLREDVGRHNAVDKLVGAALQGGALPARGTLLVVSGRVAYEIVQKAAVAGFAGIVAVGAPSSLAVEAARATGVTLVGFARDGRFNIYAGASRVGA